MRLTQDAETPIQVEESGLFRWRYAYARCEESREADEPGQDYVAFEQATSWFTFVLCDGAGQSFFGNIGARILGDHLLDFLSNRLPDSCSEDHVSRAMASELQCLTPEATSLIEACPLPITTGSILDDVLREKRSSGSESMFVCGRIDTPAPGLADGRITLIWSGDSRLRMWGAGAERSSELGPTFLTAERWSSRVGLVCGRPHVFIGPLRTSDRQLAVTHIVAYSDGLRALDTEADLPPDQLLAEMIEQARASATNDDMSLIEIWLRTD